MRSMRFIIPLCLLLLFVPIYLWKVAGYWEHESTTPVLRPDLTSKEYVLLDTTDFERGILAGIRSDDIELFARTDVVELLRQSLIKYQKSVRGYSCTLCKQERIKGKLTAPEEVDVWFKDEPYSVLMHWTKGATRAAATLYVAGENDGKLCVRPHAEALKKLIGWAKRSPDSDDAKEMSRYLITESDLRSVAERTFKVWKNVRDSGATFNVQYLGLHKNLHEVGNRDCHVIKRICNPPEEEGLTEITIYIDAETWIQVGSVLKVNDELLGSYWYKDIRLNPSFDDKHFKPETLKKY